MGENEAYIKLWIQDMKLLIKKVFMFSEDFRHWKIIMPSGGQTNSGFL